MSRKALLAAAGLVVVAAGAGLWVWQGKGPVADPANAAQVAQGRAIYERDCASCHGKDLEGQPNWRERKANGRLPAPPHDVSGHTWHHSDEVLTGIIRDGLAAVAPPGYQSDMPAYGGRLSEADIAAVLAYIKSRWPAEVRQRQQAMSGK